MERIPLSWMTRTRSTRPASMSSIRLFPFQCRLVGKLMIQRGRSSVDLLEDEHLAGTDLAMLGGFTVSLVVVLEGTTELEGDPPAHHTHAIDGVDEGVRFVLQDVAVR